MPPAKCSVTRYPHAFGYLGERQPVAQSGRLFEPLGLHPQPGERRTSQGIERLAAGSAFVPLETVGRTVLDYPLGRAVRTDRRISSASFDHLDRRRLAFARRQFRHNHLSLCPRQFPQPIHQRNQVSLPHSALLASAPLRHETSIRHPVDHRMSLSLLNGTRALIKDVLLAVGVKVTQLELCYCNFDPSRLSKMLSKSQRSGAATQQYRISRGSQDIKVSEVGIRVEQVSNTKIGDNRDTHRFALVLTAIARAEISRDSA